jgi:hypothetical protein
MCGQHICYVFQQKVGIHRGTHCAPLLADLFLSSYETDFIQGSGCRGRMVVEFTTTYAIMSSNPVPSEVYSMQHYGEKRSTVCTPMYAYFLLKNIANMLSIKNTNILMIPISENILVESGFF